MLKNSKLQLSILILLTSIGSFAQDIEKQERLANNQLRDGNELYQKAKYADAEVSYKKSMATHPGNPKAVFNLANTMLLQKRYKEAIAQYDYLAKNAKSNRLKAQSHHNIGNAQMGLNDYQKAVDAYKNSLRKNPKDEETRYNLALAQELLKNQQDQNKDNKDDKNKDKDKQEDDDQKKDEKDKEGDDEKKDDPNKDEEDDKDGDKDKEDGKDKPKDNKDDPKEDQKDQKEQPQPGKLSPQQVKQLLEAMQNEEKKTQDKVNAKKMKGQPVKTEKDW